MGRFTQTIVVATLVCAVLPSATAARSGADKDTRLEPGPRVIAPDEAAIEADPAAGVEQAVILVEEHLRNEDLKRGAIRAFHLRAKILSNEGRELANVELPLMSRDSELKEWWGRTLLPDGTVQELSRERLERMTAARARGSELEVVRAALPGVVPGAVIDYGWVVKDEGYTSYERVPIQGPWPVRSFSYRWKPTPYREAVYRLARVDKLKLRAEKRDRGVVITASDVPPVAEEPLMPPAPMVHGAVTLYYLPRGVGFKEYWSVTARAMEEVIVDGSIGNKKDREPILESMGLPADGTIEKKIRAAYDWIGDHLRRSDVETFEEIESTRDDAKPRKGRLQNLIARGEGSPIELQLLLLAVARDVGAEAHLVLAADRNHTWFDSGLKSLRQVDTTLLAVRTPGADSVWILDPGSGLAFGDFPWWYSGEEGLMLAAKGAAVVELPVASSRNNRSVSTARLDFEEDDEVLTAEWTQTRIGQTALDERRHLRRLPPEERQERLVELCGGGPDVDVVRAEVAGLEELGSELSLHCEIELPQSSLEGIDRHQLGWRGPWIVEPPDLPRGKRTHAVVFDFPRVDTVEIGLRPPVGFESVDPPASTEFETDYGKYTLNVRRDESGYTIERALAIYPLAVDAREYDALCGFLERVRRADRTVVEFRRGEVP